MSVIDELVVQLSLDPSKFTESQRQTLKSFRDIENTAERTGKTVDEVFKARIYGRPLAGGNRISDAEKQLTSLEAHSRRTGSALAAGFDTGTAALNKFVAAGLAAYGVVKTIQGAVEKIGSTIAGTTQTARVAGYTGVSPQFMSAFSRGANILTNAPQQGTEEWLFGLRQSIESVRLGDWDQKQDFLARLQIGSLDFSKDPEVLQREILEKLGQKFHGMTQSEAQAYGNRLGAPRETTQALQQHGLSGVLAAGQPYAPTAAQIEQFTKLQRAINELDQSWDKLIRAIVESHPSFLGIIGDIKNLFNEVESDPEKMNTLATAVDAVSVAFGVTLVAAVGKALFAVNSFWAAPLFKFLIANPAVAGALAFFMGMKPSAANAGEDEAVKRFRKLSPEEQRRQMTTPATPDTRSTWEKYAPSWLGGKSVPSPYPSSSAVPTPSSSSAGRPSPFSVSGIDASTAAALTAIGGPESRFKNIPNFRYDSGHTAQGYYQITNTNWRKYAPQLGVTTDNAMASSFEDQSRVAALMYKKEGFAPWDRAHGGPLPVGYSLAANTGTGSAPSRLNRGFLVPPTTPFNSRGQPYSRSLETMSQKEKDNVAASMDWIHQHMGQKGAWGSEASPSSVASYASGLSLIRSANAASRGPAQVTHNYGDVDVGDVHVHTPSRDVPGIARDLKTELKRNLDTFNANTGLE